MYLSLKPVNLISQQIDRYSKMKQSELDRFDYSVQQKIRGAFQGLVAHLFISCGKVSSKSFVQINVCFCTGFSSDSYFHFFFCCCYFSFGKFSVEKKILVMRCFITRNFSPGNIEKLGECMNCYRKQKCIMASGE